MGRSPRTDSLTINGLTYWVVGPLVFLPFLPFVPFDGLWEASRWIVPAGFGIMAAWLMLPLARRYGPGGRATWWLAILGAFGTLLFNQALRGNAYYLTHAEAMLFTVVALVEWQGRRRAWVIGLAARTRGRSPVRPCCSRSSRSAWPWCGRARASYVASSGSRRRSH